MESSRQKCARAQAEVREGVRRQRRLELADGLRGADQVGDPVGALAHVVAHRPGHVLVAPGSDQRLHNEVAAGVAPSREHPADEDE
jgi:hypothetical protein